MRYGYKGYFKDSLGVRLDFLMKEKGLENNEVAILLNIHDRNIANWRKGKNFPSDEKFITALSRIFNVKISWLLYGYLR